MSNQDFSFCIFWFTEVINQNTLSWAKYRGEKAYGHSYIVNSWKALPVDVKLLKALLNRFRSHVASFWKVSVGFLAFKDFLAFEDLCLEQELSPKVVQFVIISEKSKKFVPFLFF